MLLPTEEGMLNIWYLDWTHRFRRIPLWYSVKEREIVNKLDTVCQQFIAGASKHQIKSGTKGSHLD
jgi:hypothetical protein